uniref:Histone-lysine N-methyltransferase, H3 lysine-4 specific n=1 Tax=Kalmanozyma brasiliensis (strain GHG001) TaxID=1365824 RepID=V5ETX1_KALBG
MARPVCKSAAEKHLVDADTVDPRRGKTQVGRKALHRSHFKWDANSVGDKPLPAPRNLVLTNLSPLTPIPQVLLNIRRFGRVESSKLEMHPAIGQSLGIFHVTFAHDFDERGKPLESVAAGQHGQHAGRVAKAAWLGLKDRQLGQNVVQAFLDRSGEVLAEQIKLKIAEHDARHRRPTAPAPAPPLPQAPKKLKDSTEGIIKTLRNAEQAYVYITKPAGCDIDASDVATELRSRSDPLWVLEGDNGFYAAFKTHKEAGQCKVANETLSIGGYILQVDARRAPSQLAPSADKKPASKLDPGAPPTSAVQMRQKLDTGLRPLTAEERQKTDWTAAELQQAVFRLLQKELAHTFLRDVKSRTVTQHLGVYLKEGGEGKAILDKPMIKVSVPSAKVSDRQASSLAADGEARLPTFRKLGGTKPKKPVSDADEVASRARWERKKHSDVTHKPKACRSKEVVSSDDEIEDTRRGSKISSRRDSGANVRTKQRSSAALLLDSTDDEEDDLDDGASTQQDAASTPATADHLDEEPTPKGKKGSKAKASLATKKKGTSTARKGSKVDGTPSEVDAETEHGSETATPEVEVPVKAAKAKAKSAKATAKPKPIPADPFEAGVVEDAEECAYLRLALEHLNETGELPSEETLPDEIELEAEAEEQAIASGTIPKHTTGSARTEGYYRIPPEQKALHLPDRNKATEEVDTSQNAQVLQSARNNRADSRRLVLGIEQHKRETATDTDIFKFNQLRTRKKQLKFAKSPIHDWGLYAMEFIPAGDMVIEYVGEMVRQQVADEREKRYERQGNFSTYLFRVDDDLVVDATHKGNIARLMNHCCTPNCNAKILTLNGEKRIVLFAKSPIRAGEELTYDYKFQSSADDEDAIPCLCGSPGCRRFL